MKTLSDAERARVDLTPMPTTIATLGATPLPTEAPLGRAAPVELTTYQVEAYLAGFDDEADGDVHLVLVDPVVPDARLIAEIPDPECAGACASGLAEAYARARAALQAAVTRPNPDDRPVRLRVTGVGFFDRNHGQLGAAPNYIELHPVLAVEVLP